MKRFKLFTPVVIILVLALGLRLPSLNGSFWLDEAAQALESSRPLNQQFNIIPDFQPPLIHLLTHFALYISQQEWWLRLISALIPGLITIWAGFHLGRKLFNRYTGLITGLLLATNSFHVFYSQELRPYSLPAMWATLSWLSLINLTKPFNNFPQKKPPKWTHWLGFALLTLAGLYSSYLYPFLVIAQLAYILLTQKISLNNETLKRCLISIAVAIIGFLPWLPTFIKQLQTGQQLRQTLPGWDTVVSLTQLKALPLTIAKFVFGLSNLEANWFYVTASSLIAMFTLGLIIIIAKLIRRKQLKLNKFLIPVIWFTVPLITSWLVSFWVPVIRPKRLLFLLPALYLLLASLVTASLNQLAQLKPKIIIRFSAYVLLIILFGLNFYSLSQYYLKPKFQRENWRSLYSEIQTRFPERETVAVFSFRQPFAPWRWYNRGQFPALATGKNNIKQVDNLNQQLKPIFDYDFVLVFDYLRDLTDPNDQLPQAVESYGYTQIGTIERPKIGFVRIYVKQQLVSQYQLDTKQ
jgi:uncharacterized membrane protein